MKYLRAGGLAAWGLAFVAAAASCAERDTSQVTGLALAAPDAGLGPAALACVPGQTLACMGACGAPLSGYQVCAADGRSYEPCICPPSRPLPPLPLSTVREDGGRVIVPRIGPGGAARPVLGAPGSFAEPRPGQGAVGAACRNDDDCIPELDCLSARTNSFGVGGPAGGYCSLPCGSQEDCTSVDPGSGCATVGGVNRCVRMCASREPALAESKCLSREDVTCVSVAALGEEEPAEQPQLGICVPQCRSDAECDGRFCDLGTGLCTDMAPAGAPVGARCEAAEDCAGGICLGLSDEFARFCSAFCTLGVPGCGFDGSEAQSGATCLLPQVPGEAAGDRGLCFELCDVDGDCREPGSVCVEQPADGRAGVCILPLTPAEPPPGPPAPEPPTSGEPPNIGAACAADLDCGPGLSCLSADSDPFGAGGGPAGGYCSASCQADADCPEAGTLCVRTAGGGYCLRGCDLEAEDDCGGRDTLSCDPLPGGATPRGFCRPQCNTDADCGARVCSANGLCGAAPPRAGCTTDADCGVGEACDPELGECAPALAGPECTSDEDCGLELCDLDRGECVAAPECTSDEECGVGVCDPDRGICEAEPACSLDADCTEGVCDPGAGRCIPAPAIPAGGACTLDAECAGQLCASVAGSRFCSALCLLGTPIGCEPYGSDAFCLLPADDQNQLGVCIELCDTPADCSQSGYECLELGEELNGRSGGCLPPLPAP